MIRLQYISQGRTPQEHLKNIENACKAGCRWIQLRLKDVDMATYLNTALQCRNICDQYDAIMIVNDNVSVTKAVLADGIHLGLSDMNPREARKILGDNFIIGGTANTIENCLQHLEDSVDYIGLGPYKHTVTKKKLSPILGVEGYRNILGQLKNKNLKVPVVAIGGITEKDIEILMQTGVSGIAISGMLTNQTDLKKKIETIKKLLANR
ncbi:thiamine-phosphate diphosphorylase [Aquimarina sp. MAR_2010_214]|uniref:thiamine phosphate synthase n=1 Tax=Aquimarina sp. MAR_2010_214 TaxID=1250026 RepID=UPI000C71536E|nr:thiamine phosphate synthase [Aquimarina sp. MAR_2010_214]PKV48413.1 thiamine-phosphate diphosphorylase [Aquimarina sp. MAR_2010_214]